MIATLLSGCSFIAITYLEYNKDMDDVAFSGGDGTKQSPYIIATPEDLKNLSIIMRPNNWTRTYANAYYVQTKDIDLGGVVWAPIGFYNDITGYTQREYYAFSGSYDGLGHEISNMKISIEEFADILPFAHSGAQGLFGVVLRQGNPDVGIRNLILQDADIVCKNYDTAWRRILCGGLVGLIPSEDVTVENCTVASIDMNTTALDVGMLVGENYGRISNSYASGSIGYIVLDSYSCVGGGIGSNRGYVNDCQTDCKMSLKIELASDYRENEMWIGGFAGRNGDEEDELVQAEIKNTSAMGTLSLSGKNANSNLENYNEIELIVGGFVGDNQGQSLPENNDASFVGSKDGRKYQFIGSVEYIFYQGTAIR
jgi:hypothetical protein